MASELGILDAVSAVREFQDWLDSSGRSYLADGLGDMEVGQALLKIYEMAGIRGITGQDYISKTLPMAKRLIELRCKPR